MLPYRRTSKRAPHGFGTGLMPDYYPRLQLSPDFGALADGLSCSSLGRGP